MKLMGEPIKAKAHGEIDYGFSAVNVTVPALLGLEGPARRIPAVFALMQGGINALTDQPVGVKRLIPLRTHGWIEAATIPALAGVVVVSGALDTTRAKVYFGAMGLALGVIYALTDWNAAADS